MSPSFLPFWILGASLVLAIIDRLMMPRPSGGTGRAMASSSRV